MNADDEGVPRSPPRRWRASRLVNGARFRKRVASGLAVVRRGGRHRLAPVAIASRPAALEPGAAFDAAPRSVARAFAFASASGCHVLSRAPHFAVLEAALGSRWRSTRRDSGSSFLRPPAVRTGPMRRPSRSRARSDVYWTVLNAWSGPVRKMVAALRLASRTRSILVTGATAPAVEEAAVVDREAAGPR